MKPQAMPFDSVIEDSHGIAQIYPEDKFSIVKTLQRIGHVVGMTGDGVNDAPALGQAEVGIAVKNATDIAKDSASAVLTVEGLGGIIGNDQNVSDDLPENLQLGANDGCPETTYRRVHRCDAFP